MHEGRAVAGRKANPFVCLAPTIRESPIQSVDPPSIFCRRGAACCARHRYLANIRQFDNWLGGPVFASSNRNWPKNRTYRKQTIKPCLTETRIDSGHFEFFSHFVPQPTGFNAASAPFLTGSGSQTEFDVTHSKQTTEKFLTGARMHIKDFDSSHHFRAQSCDGGYAPIGKNRKSRCRAEGPRHGGHAGATVKPSITAGVGDATAASQRTLLSGFLAGLCWIWDTCGSTLTRSRRWRGTAESRWTWRRFARSTPSGGNRSPRPDG